MSEAKHTRGPWTVEEYGDRDYPNLVLHSDSETRVCFMATPGSNGDPARIAADARLIAAAPDLLEALIETWRVIGAAGLLNLSNGVQLGQTSWYVKASDAEALSRAAIAKATSTPEPIQS